MKLITTSLVLLLVALIASPVAFQVNASQLGACFTGGNFQGCPGVHWFPWPHSHVCVPGTPMDCSWSVEDYQEIGECGGGECGCCFGLNEFMSCHCEDSY